MTTVTRGSTSSSHSSLSPPLQPSLISTQHFLIAQIRIVALLSHFLFIDDFLSPNLSIAYLLLIQSLLFFILKPRSYLLHSHSIFSLYSKSFESIAFNFDMYFDVIISMRYVYLINTWSVVDYYMCSWFSGVNPLVGFEPSIFELSIFIRGKGKNE